jgi:tRNA threonylcarbamoyladenosine biosynthesis protein TsaE
MEFIFKIDEIDDIANKIMVATKGKTLFALQGAMGSGKTTFTKAFCKTLGVKDMVSSPTFSIINVYNTIDVNAVYHMDLYRLKNLSEAINAGVEDYLYTGNICLVEWPQIIESILPPDVVFININIIDAKTRKIEF